MGEVIVMLKRIVKTIVLSMLFLLAIPVFCYGFSIDLQLSTEYAKTGDSITISGQADANSWISIKVLDEGQNIIYFNAVKSDEYGRYSDSFIVPENIEGCLTVVAGAGANVASQTLLVGRLSTQVSLELSSYEAVVGESITVFGTADPNSWVALKAVDEEGSILFFDAVKADGDGNYSLDLVIPEMAAVSLEIIAGYGDNIASQTLLVGSLSTQVSLELSSYEAIVGDSITVFGTADPNSWVALKAVDEEGSILFFDTVKADGDGNYSLDLVIPEMAAVSLEIIAGYGDNIASQTLLVGSLSTQVSLELSSYEAIVGDSITVFGTADPNSWVALKAVDEEGSILFFDTVKADGDGNYSLDLIIPEMAAGSLKIIAGYGDNTASRSITIRAELDECFIATAAFGSKFEPSVALLRAFRDKYLLNNNMGQALVKFYYQNSPPLANYIAASEPLKALVRILLIPFIVMAYISFHPLWICLMLGMGFALLLWHRRKRNWQLKGN